MTDEYDIVRSPLNFTGSKYKYMRYILDYLPPRIRIFEDWFSGGGNVFANIWPHITAIQIRVADIDAGIIALLVAMGYQSPYQFIKEVQAVVEEHGLNRTDKKAYYAYRSKINSREIPLHAPEFMALIAHSYNNMIRWNQSGDFNVPFGKRTFNDKMRDNTFAFINRLNRIPNLTFYRRDFRRMRTRHLTADDLVFCDPPYLLGTAAYNSDWTEKDERALHCKLDVVHARGSRFMLIDALEHKGERNHVLEEWAKRYRVVDIWADYSKGYKATRKTGGITREILVMNYEQTT